MSVFLSVLGVILAVLKWLGIILLGLVALLVLILLIVLLAPISYRIEGGKAGEEVTARVKASYLFHLLRVRLDFIDKKLSYTVKVAWKEVASSAEPSGESAPLDAEAPSAELPAAKEPEPAPPETQPAEPKAIAEPEAKPEPEARPEPEAKPEPAEQIAEESLGEVVIRPREEEPKKEAKKKPKRASLGDSVEKSMSALEEGVEKLEDWIFEAVDFLLDLPDAAEELFDEKTRPLRRYYRMYEGYPRKKETLQAILLLLWRLLKPVLPKQMKVKALFGTGDPFSSAQILGAYEAAYPLIFLHNRKRDLDLTVDLQEKQLDLSGFASGRFMLQSFVWALIRALLNQDIRRLIRFVLKMKKRKES